MQAFDDLLKVGATAFPTLVKLAAAEDNRAFQRELHTKLSQQVSRLSGEFILDGKNAELVRLIGDPEALAAMGVTASAAAAGPYSWDAIGRRTLQLYTEL